MKQEFTFQTEIKQLLHILSHSLYQNREIALRELISNASDSLNKLRHIQLSEEQYRDDAPLEITLEPNKEARVLTIRDNGIGLTHDEFKALIRTGHTDDHPQFGPLLQVMPWPTFRNMTDRDIRAIYEYLSTLPP